MINENQFQKVLQLEVSIRAVPDGWWDLGKVPYFSLIQCLIFLICSAGLVTLAGPEFTVSGLQVWWLIGSSFLMLAIHSLAGCAQSSYINLHSPVQNENICSKSRKLYNAAIPLLGTYPKGLKEGSQKRYLHTRVQRSVIHNSQEAETTQVFISG